MLTLVAYGLDPLFRSGRHSSMEKQYVDQIVQDFEIQKTESYAALTRQQVIDRWLPLAKNYDGARFPDSCDRSFPHSKFCFWIVEWKVDCDPDWVLSVNLSCGQDCRFRDGWSRIQLADDAGFVLLSTKTDPAGLSGSLYPQVARLKMRLDPMTFSLDERLFTDGSGGIFQRVSTWVQWLNHELRFRIQKYSCR